MGQYTVCLLYTSNEAIGKFEGLDAEQVKAQIADYKQRAEAAEKDRDEKLAAAAFDAKIDKALSDAKAHNPKLARGALDLDALRASKNQDGVSQAKCLYSSLVYRFSNR